jgi:glycosyltransferase involved in cell wall biosynthesis
MTLQAFTAADSAPWVDRHRGHANRPSRAPEPPLAGTTSIRALRIGVWCDYGATLVPTEGIGVFVYSLVAGLLSLPDQLEIVMLVRPGDEHVVEHLRKRGRGRLRVIPEVRCAPAWMRFTDRARAAKRLVEQALQRPPLRNRFALGPVRCLLNKLLRRTLRGLGRLDRSMQWQAQAEMAKAAACDVWLIPYGDFPIPLDFPSVFAVHDLVCIHFPDMWEQAEQQRLETHFRRRAAEATLCACMSLFIRDRDLIGVLGLSAAKARMVAPAPPVDLVAADASGSPLPLDRPYIFYPAGFRSYKNHRVLIEAIHSLRQAGHDAIDLVFTGSGPMPEDLQQLVQRYQLTDRVHVLGCVDRSNLATLYRRAVATMIPALYEQGSFPIYEALRYGCPVACSAIPPFQEQCALLGAAMLYFDPHNAGAVAEMIRLIRGKRETIRERQRLASRAIWKRTWKEAAREWLALFREAAETGRAANRSAA